MKATRLFTAIVLAVASQPAFRAQTAESPVVLEAFRVSTYLENYATGSSFSALRVNAPLLEIPLSTSIITPGLLLDQGITDVNTAVRNIAGAQAVQGGSEFQNYYFTRGMPNFFYRDGIRMDLDGGNITPNAAGLENIEVLKGPSSILYGRGTPGGIVNFNSKRPLAQTRRTLLATYGSHEFVRGDLDVTGAATRAVAYRLVGTYEDAGSHRDGVSHTTSYLNPSVTVNVGDKSQLFVLAELADQRLAPDGGIATRPDGRLPGWVKDGTNFARSFNSTTPRKATVDFGSARGLAEFRAQINPGYQLRVMGSYLRFDHNGSDLAMNLLDSAAGGVPGMLGPNQLLRVWNSKHGKRDLAVLRCENIFDFTQRCGDARLAHQILVSLDQVRTDTDMVSAMQDHEILDLNTQAATPVWQYFGRMGLGTTRDGQLIYDNGTNRTRHRDSAVAMQDNIKISESWRLLLGLRYEENQADLERDQENYIVGAMPRPVVAHNVDHATKSRLLPRIGVLFKAGPQLALFGNYLTSFIPAGATQVGRNGLIAPETGDQLEAGLKYELVASRLFATASVFKIRRQDIATHFQDPVTYATYWKASDQEESTGAELELTGAVAKGLNVVAHLGYIDNEFTRTDLAAKTGRGRHGLAQVTGSLWGTYDVSAPGLRGWRLGLRVFHSGKQYLDDYNTVAIGGRTLCDAMIACSRQRWTVQVNLHNLFDRHTWFPAGSGYNDPAYPFTGYNTAVQTVIPGPGTEVQVKLGYAF